VYAGVKGRKDIKADPSTQMMFPTVQQMIRELRNFVAQIPAMSREMICRDRPAQSSRAALKVEKPSPLMMGPLKFVRTPFGTLEPNMASVRSQALGSSRASMA
jgi:hypothetical protein